MDFFHFKQMLLTLLLDIKVTFFLLHTRKHLFFLFLSLIELVELGIELSL